LKNEVIPLLLYKEFPTFLLKKAVQIIESETPENMIIDKAFARIYEEDKNYVIARLRERLIESNRVRIAGIVLAYAIQKMDYFPVIQMLEEEIDNGNHKIIYSGEYILEEFFPSKQEWLKWCKKWKDDKRKREVILRSLGRILTELMNYQPSSIRNEAIALVKEFANREGLDYEEETKKINLGKDSHEGAEHKESTIRALCIIKRLLYPPVQIDSENLRENLNNYPYLSKAIGSEWLVKNANTKHPHLLAYIYKRKIEHDKVGELLEMLESEKNENKKLQIALQYDSIVQSLGTQLYWEQVFKTLDEYNMNIPKSKLRDMDNAESILAEAEVIARLAPYFKVKLEPDITEFRPKKLDAKIEYNGQEALIEIAFVKERIELDVAHGGIWLPGGKIKSVLHSKFKTQLKEGKVNPKIPVIIILCLDNFLDDYEVENAIYGQLQIHFGIRTDHQQIVEDGSTRANNSFYEIEGTDIVTAIAAYKRNYTKKDPLIGKLYRPPLWITPKNPINKELRIRLRNALFGDSENSNWQSLLKIKGIDEDIAKKLYADGIEDLGVLAMATDDELQIGNFDIQTMKELQKEAKRIINAQMTGSIRFLKGINRDNYNLLAKEGVYLIKQVLELADVPKGIESSVWEEIIEDAQRIMANHDV